MSSRALVERLGADRLVAFGLALVVALPFVGAPRAQFGDDDLEYAVPFARFVLGELAEGRWPAWNPTTDAGVPLLVQQPWMGPVYPGLVLFALLPDGVALSAGYAAHAALYAVGVLLLLRRLGLGRSAAVLGALALGLGSDVAVAWNRGYLHHLVAVSWMPWPLLALEHARASSRPAVPVAAGALAVGASFLGGHPVSAMLMLLAAGVWCALAALADAREHGPRRGARVLLCGAAMAVAGLALAAVQLVPLAGLSGGEGSLAAVRAYKPWDAEMAEPWRRVGYLLPRWAPGQKGREFIGLVVLMLVPLGLASLTRASRHRSGVGAAALAGGLAEGSVAGPTRWMPVLGTAVVFAGLAAGPHLPVLGWVQSLLPPLGAVSYSYFTVPPVHLGLAWLAGLALERGLRPDRGLAPRVLGGLAVALSALALAWLAARAPVASDPLDRDGLAASLVPTLAVVAPLTAILLAAASGRRRPARVAGALLVLAVVELGWYRADARYDKRAYHSSEYFRRPDALGPHAGRLRMGPPGRGAQGWDERNQPGRVFHVEDASRARDWALRRNGGMVLGYEEIRRSARLGWEPYRELTEPLERWWVDWEAALVRDDAEHAPAVLELDATQLAVLDRLAVRRIVTDMELGPMAADAFAPVDRDGARTGWERRDPPPRVFVTASCFVAEDLPGGAIDRWAELGPRTVALKAPSSSCATDGDPRAGAVEIGGRAPGRWWLSVHAERDALLVLREAAVDGWRATVGAVDGMHAPTDGTELPVLRADGVFVAVELPAGDHRVELAYRPPRWPMALSALVLLVLVGFLGVAERRRA